jgi:mono/diheme cytochrome c family protein
MSIMGRGNGGPFATTAPGGSSTVFRSLPLGIPALAALVLLSGCGNIDTRYPESLRYPIRKDVLTPDTPFKDQPATLPFPGHLDDAILAAFKKELWGPESGTLTDEERKKRNEQVEKGLAKADPTKLTRDERRDLAEALEDRFGTPRNPKVRAKAAGALGLDDAGRLNNGSRLYRMHCMHCHGVSGDGRGPTGPWVHPHPRDYRKGEFKYITTQTGKGARRPRRDDLRRVLRNGIDGTSMPTFGILPADEIDDLLSYVTHLSIRGETEASTIAEVLEKGPERKEGAVIVGKVVGEAADRIADDWKRSNDDGPIPAAEYPEKFTSGEDEGRAKERRA